MPGRLGSYSTRYNAMTRTAVSQLTLRIHASVLAVTLGVIGGVTLSAMTAWLLIKGGTNVGPHLQLLGQYFWGYSVSWRGCVVGFFYGAIVGATVGWSVARIYNSIARLRARR